MPPEAPKCDFSIRRLFFYNTLDLFRKKNPGIEIRMNVGYTQTVVEDIHHKGKYISRLIRAFMDEVQRSPVPGGRISPIGSKPLRVRKTPLSSKKALGRGSPGGTG